MDKMFLTAMVKEVNKEERTIVAWASRAILDRDREVLPVNAWKWKEIQNGGMKPKFLAFHDHKIPAVGRILWLKKESDGMKFKSQFNESSMGKELWPLYRDGDMDSFSVGFIPDDNGWDDFPEAEKSAPKRIYKDNSCALLEISCVNIPSCPAAVVDTLNHAVDSGKILEKEFIEAVKEMDALHTKPETTDAYHHVPVRSKNDFVDTSFRTITLSAKDGIKAVIGKLKSDPNGSTVIQKYLFDVKKFSMEEAKKWVADHKEGKGIEQIIIDFLGLIPTDEDGNLIIEKAGRTLSGASRQTIQKCIDEIDAASTSLKAYLQGTDTPPESTIPGFGGTGGFAVGGGKEGKIEEDDFELEEKGAIPYKDLGKADEGENWDASQWTGADVADLKQICAWYDSSKPDLAGSYKLPHHRRSDKKAVWRGVAAAMAALLGARGGVSIPAGDKSGVHSHLARHYKEFDKPVPGEKDYSPEELAELFPEIVIEKTDKPPESCSSDKDGKCPEGYEMGDDKQCHLIPKKEAELESKAPLLLKPDEAGKCPNGYELGDDKMCHLTPKKEVQDVIQTDASMGSKDELALDELTDDEQVIFKLVDGDQVRKEQDPDFKFGGHHYIYDFIPENEIWIESRMLDEDIIAAKARQFTERQLMKYFGFTYEMADNASSIAEKIVRHVTDEGEDGFHDERHLHMFAHGGNHKHVNGKTSEPFDEPEVVNQEKEEEELEIEEKSGNLKEEKEIEIDDKLVIKMFKGMTKDVIDGVTAKAGETVELSLKKAMGKAF